MSTYNISFGGKKKKRKLFQYKYVQSNFNGSNPFGTMEICG